MARPAVGVDRLCAWLDSPSILSEYCRYITRQNVHLEDIGGGCLLAVTDPGFAKPAAQNGVDLDEVRRYCRD